MDKRVGVECLVGGGWQRWKISECHCWGQSYGRKKARETGKSRHPGRLLTIQMTHSHVLSAEGCLCQQHRPSYSLQQLSNICSLALTDEKGPVKMGRERTTRHIALLIMRSCCSVDQNVVHRSCSQALLHVVCMPDGSYEWEMWAVIKVFVFVCHAPSTSAVLKVFPFISLF